MDDHSYRANVVIRDCVIDGNDMKVHIRRDFAKRSEADAWLTGARDALAAAAEPANYRRARFSLYGPEGHQIAMRERGRKEYDG